MSGGKRKRKKASARSDCERPRRPLRLFFLFFLFFFGWVFLCWVCAAFLFLALAALAALAAPAAAAALDRGGGVGSKSSSPDEQRSTISTGRGLD